MEVSDEWKSVFSIGSSLSPPLLLSSPDLGPLLFNPLPKTLTPIASSPSLSPPLLSPQPSLSLPRFLLSSTSPHCPPLPSSASSLSSFSPPYDAASLFSHNRLLLLLLKHPRGAVLFFPTGPNLNHVGFLLLTSLDDSIVPLGKVDSFRLRDGQRVIRIVVNPFQSDDLTIGFLLVCSLYSVHWLRVRIEAKGTEKPPTLEFLGFKLFKKFPICDARWNPHLPEESAVLLEDGSLFLFDLNSVFAFHIKGRRYNPLQPRKENWIGCEYTWHPRVFLVVSSSGCYSLDLRCRECEVTRLVSASESDALVTFCKACDDFRFVLVSSKLVILLDVRRPLVPLLKWAHNLSNPQYVVVSRLSDLRSKARIRDCSETGWGIILASFWKCEFNLFCYGPSPEPNGSIRAWGAPSAIAIGGGKCCCSACVIGDEFWRYRHEEWVPWQKKREIVLGFGILSMYLDFDPKEDAEFGGFTVIRLTSSGELQAQRFAASWSFDSSHVSPSSTSGEVLLYETSDERYKFTRKFKYLKLKYLRAYLNGSFSQIVDCGSDKSTFSDDRMFSLENHKTICETLESCGLGRSRSAPTISIVFDELYAPTSIHEIATRKLWSSLPVELLQLAIARYSNMIDEVTDQMQRLEFLPLPISPQPPPFWLRLPSNRANKWPKNSSPSDSLVGPVLPLPMLLAMREVRSGCSMKEFSVEKEVGDACEQAMEVAEEMTGDRERNVENSKYLLNAMNDDKYNGQLVSRRYSGEGMFDEVCPVQLKFDYKEKPFSDNECKVYKILKRQFVTWQMDFLPYKEYLSNKNL